ncbi:hypothetical protein L6452_08542 [Arctium lappa]|uniref:Uncharacterized protein n=1 Tax=Arctium lappa TaxID=4217 RepID=A0ACB9DHZ7_ARCLA|nr:hypothetical protein L6452_08542 [Arctium lappa]
MSDCPGHNGPTCLGSRPNVRSFITSSSSLNCSQLTASILHPLLIHSLQYHTYLLGFSPIFLRSNLQTFRFPGSWKK